jgi:D-aspartate ligase
VPSGPAGAVDIAVVLRHRRGVVSVPEPDTTPIRGDLGALPPDVPAAVVMNSHITGLAVARSLGRAGVPVVGLDDEPGGLGQHSRHLTALLHCPSPTTDGGRALAEFLERLAGAFPLPPVVFPTNDDWVLALAEHHDLLEPAYRFPFARAAVLRATLAKTDLYRAAEREGVAVPRSWYLDGVPLAELPSSALLDEVAAALPYPCVLKPDDSRGFYRDYGAKVLMVDGPEQLRRQVAGTAARGLRMVAQEIVAPPPGGFFSVCSYLDAAGRARGVFVGRKLEQYPPGFGTSCLADARFDAKLADAGIRVLASLGYHGISEVEFVWDQARGQHLLLDVNPRPWKWIGLPVAAGVDLPLLAYRDTVGSPFDAPPQRDGMRWVFLRDYVRLVKERAGTVPDEQVTKDEWLDLVRGSVPAAGRLVDAVLDPDDPEPFYDVLSGELNGSAYACAC